MKDVTDLVEFGSNDDECLPLYKCVCGAKYESWKFTLSIYSDPDWANECKFCGRKLYFSISIRVYEIDKKG